jgi:hypothetical protein
MTIYTMPRRPAALPIAPKAVDSVLLRELIANSSKLHGHALVLADRARWLQHAIERGTYYSKRELTMVQRHARTALAAARVHRDLGSDTLAALDRLTCFVRGEPMTTTMAA